MSTAAEYVRQGIKAQQAFIAAVEGFDSSRWDQKPAPDEWSMRELLTHFFANTQGHVVKIKAILGEGAPFDRRNKPWQADMDAAFTQGFEAVVAWIKADHERHVGYLQAISDDHLSRGGSTGHGTITIEHLLKHYADHGQDHARQATAIRKAVAGGS